MAALSRTDPDAKPSAPPAHSAGAVEDWQSALRAGGYRLTPQRGLVLEAVQHLEHATPDEVLSYLRERATGINISTIYRTLDLLESLGLVTHTHLAHGAPTYHSATVAEHAHVVCRDCSTVTEVPAKAVSVLVGELSEELGFRTDVNHLTIFGTCAHCMTSRESSS